MVVDPRGFPCAGIAGGIVSKDYDENDNSTMVLVFGWRMIPGMCLRIAASIPTWTKETL